MTEDEALFQHWDNLDKKKETEKARFERRWLGRAKRGERDENGKADS